MTIEEKLATERRGRLAAERLLEQKSRELLEANRKLSHHARHLSDEIVETRQQAEDLKGRNDEVMSELKVVTHAVEIAERRLWNSVETIRDGFAVFDCDDRMVAANRAYFSIFDGLEAVAPGVHYHDIARLIAAEGIVDTEGLPPAEWTGRMIARWNSHPAPDREIRLWNGQYIRLIDRRTPDGDVVSLNLNITHQKRQQQALEEALRAAESANRAKTAFLANMSHELRTPMNGVVGMAELLCETGMNEEQRLYAETIRNSGEALLMLLNDVLDFSKIEAAKLNLRCEPFDLERVIHEVVMLLQATAHGKALDLMIDYDMFLPTRFEGDRGRIRQILTNLIGNAVKFTDAGHVLVRVVGIEAEAAGHQQVHITIEDTGIGIAPEMQAHIFGEFNQVEDQQNRKFEGSGLGLAISRRLVALMGGEIWVESEKGQGACFGIRLNMPTAEDGAAPPVSLPEGLERVLVVDDQEINRTILDGQLRQLGLEVIAHRNGAEALAAREAEGAVELVITDHRMPGMDGPALAAALREAGCIAPVLLLSSDTAYLDKGALPDAVDMVLGKPVLRRTLFEALCALTDTPASPGPEPAAPRRMRVLAAEDNKTNQLVFSKMLRTLDLELVFADDGKGAVEAFAASRPDLIFMDISMPGLDGKAATRAIRAREEETGARPVPIVALTAHALEGDAEDILAAGLDDYLTKPLKRGEILRTIAEHTPSDCRPPEAEPQAAAGPPPDRGLELAGGIGAAP